MISQVFYHGANGGPYNEKASVLPLCYHGAQAVVKKLLFAIFFLPVPVAGSKPLT